MHFPSQTRLIWICVPHTFTQPRCVTLTNPKIVHVIFPREHVQIYTMMMHWIIAYDRSQIICIKLQDIDIFSLKHACTTLRCSVYKKTKLTLQKLPVWYAIPFWIILTLLQFRLYTSHLMQNKAPFERFIHDWIGQSGSDWAIWLKTKIHIRDTKVLLNGFIVTF